MANSRLTFLPESASFPASNFPQLQDVNRRKVLSFDAATNETCQWTFIAPQGLTGTLNAVIFFMMASATADTVDVDVSIEAITPGDALDLDAGDSFDSVNSQDNTTVPGTAGFMEAITVALTNKDSIAAGDLCRLKLTRDASSDDATGDMHVLAVELRDDV